VQYNMEVHLRMYSICHTSFKFGERGREREREREKERERDNERQRQRKVKINIGHTVILSRLKNELSIFETNTIYLVSSINEKFYGSVFVDINY